MRHAHIIGSPNRLILTTQTESEFLLRARMPRIFNRRGYTASEACGTRRDGRRWLLFCGHGQRGQSVIFTARTERSCLYESFLRQDTGTQILVGPRGIRGIDRRFTNLVVALAVTPDSCSYDRFRLQAAPDNVKQHPHSGGPLLPDPDFVIVCHGDPRNGRRSTRSVIKKET